MHNKTGYKSLGSLLALTLLSGAILSAPKANADTSATVDLTINVPAACSLTPANTYLTNTINPGTNKEIGTANLKAVCNDPEGFAIYAVGLTGDNYGDNNLRMIDGDALSQTHFIPTGTATSGNTSNWNMTIANSTEYAANYTANIENHFDSPSDIPNTYTKIASLGSATDQATGTNLTATFNAYIAPSQVAGTYEGKVKFMLVHPSTEAPDTTPLGLAYASRNKTKVNGYYSMQDMSSDICSALSIGDEGNLIDTRDNTVYPIAKLADGKCWITKNLRLDLSKANITAENTNNPTQDFLAKLAINSAPTNNGSWNSDVDSIKYSNQDIDDTTVDSFGDSYDDYGVYYNWYTATAGNGTSETLSNENASGDICPKGWHLPTGGNYYSSILGDYSRLAIALGVPESENGSAQRVDTTSSPSLSEMKAIFMGEPMNYVGAGMYYDGMLRHWNFTEYWTSTAQYSYSVYTYHFMHIDAGAMWFGDSQNFGYKYTGHAMRCLAD